MIPAEVLVPEHVHPDFDARLFERFDQPELLSVYADWLEERTDPRAQLIRLQLKMEDEEARTPMTVELHRMADFYRRPRSPARYEADALVSECWVRWFGGLSPSWLELFWQFGFVRGAELAPNTVLGSGLRTLLRRPVMRFLRSLKIADQGEGGSMDGLDELRALRELSWTMNSTGALDPLHRRCLPSLMEWRLRIATVPTERDLQGLRTVQLPRLKRLKLEVPQSHEARIVEELAHASWFNSLDYLRITLTTCDATTRLIEAKSSPFRMGWGLTLCLPPFVLAVERDRLHRVVPYARLENLGRQGAWEFA